MHQKKTRKVKKRVNSKEPQNALQLMDNDNDLVMRWIEKKIEISNGLRVDFDPDNKCIKFELRDEDESLEGYQELLQAKIYDTFGVSDVNVALTLIINCVNSIYSYSSESSTQDNAASLRRCFSEVISLFREFGPRDPFEAMMVSKLIIVDITSTREFMSANSSEYIDRKTIYQNRGIKLSRLWLEIKDKLDKHRKPNQQINVQHNHIHNEGQAIIGSQLSMGGGGN